MDCVWNHIVLGPEPSFGARFVLFKALLLLLAPVHALTGEKWAQKRELTSVFRPFSWCNNLSIKPLFSRHQNAERLNVALRDYVNVIAFPHGHPRAIAQLAAQLRSFEERQNRLGQ